MPLVEDMILPVVLSNTVMVEDTPIMVFVARVCGHGLVIKIRHCSSLFRRYFHRWTLSNEGGTHGAHQRLFARSDIPRPPSLSAEQGQREDDGGWMAQDL